MVSMILIGYLVSGLGNAVLLGNDTRSASLAGPNIAQAQASARTWGFVLAQCLAPLYFGAWCVLWLIMRQFSREGWMR